MGRCYVYVSPPMTHNEHKHTDTDADDHTRTWWISRWGKSVNWGEPFQTPQTDGNGRCSIHASSLTTCNKEMSTTAERDGRQGGRGICQLRWTITDTSAPENSFNRHRFVYLYLIYVLQFIAFINFQCPVK